MPDNENSKLSGAEVRRPLPKPTVELGGFSWAPRPLPRTVPSAGLEYWRVTCMGTPLPEGAKRAVEVCRGLAKREFDSAAASSAEWTAHEWTHETIRYVCTVFSAFGEQLCLLLRSGEIDIETNDRYAEEFLLQLSRHVDSDQRLTDSSSMGGLWVREEVLREVKNSTEYRGYEEARLNALTSSHLPAHAPVETGVSAGASENGSECAGEGGPLATEPMNEDLKLSGRERRQAELSERRHAFIDPILVNKGWTPGKWGTDAGVSKNMPYRYLNGTCPQLKKDDRKAMAESLNIAPEDLP